MPGFTVGRFAKVCQTLYHVTSPKNLGMIRARQALYSADRLYALAHAAAPVEPRSANNDIDIGDETVRIRDQRGVVAGNIRFDDDADWGMSDLVRELNHRVFWWPELAAAERHLHTYEEERPTPVVLRVDTKALFGLEMILQDDPESPVPWFCKYNSGFPRWNPNGPGDTATPSPRGPGMFVRGWRALFTASDVREVTFVDEVALPARVEMKTGHDIWSDLNSTLLSFAYGSNMCTGWLQGRVPSARYVGMARLAGHQLRFHKRSDDGSAKADAFHTGDANHEVWGVLAQLDVAEKWKLDEAEGLGNGYHEVIVDVTDAAGQRHRPLMYQTDANAIDSALAPYAWYKDLVIVGGQARGLPGAYLGTLQAVTAIADSDVSRVAKATGAMANP